VLTAGTVVTFDRVVIGVITAVGVWVTSGVCVAGGSVPSCFAVHPEPTTNSTQMNAIKATAITFWCMVTNGEQDYKN
jgi:hypothetical protein